MSSSYKPSKLPSNNNGGNSSKELPVLVIRPRHDEVVIPTVRMGLMNRSQSADLGSMNDSASYDSFGSKSTFVSSFSFPVLL
jgi:hypothetical protein